MSDSPVTPPPGREPTMVSVVGSSSTDSWPYTTQRIIGVDGNSIPESDVHSEDEEEDEALGVVDNITAQNFLQESDLMNAASSALGHKKSPSQDDHLDNLLDGSAYHSGGLVPADLSPSSNSSASSLDLPTSSGVGLPPVSTIIRPKSRFDAFCRPLIMGLPQFATFDVMSDAPSPMPQVDDGIDNGRSVMDDSVMMTDGHSTGLDDQHSVMMADRHSAGLDDSHSVMMTDGHSSGLDDQHSVMMADRHVLDDGHSTGMDDSHSVMMADGHPAGLDDGRSALEDQHSVMMADGHSTGLDDQHSVIMADQHVLDDSAIDNSVLMEQRLDDSGGMDDSRPEAEFGRFADIQAIEEMHKMPFVVNSEDVLRFMTAGGSYGHRTAIETNVIMSTSSGSKISVADFKALEQRLIEQRTAQQQQADGVHGTRVEVIIPDCIVTSQSTDGVFTNVVQSALGESSKKAIPRSTIIEKNKTTSNESSTVITSKDKLLKATPPAITASVIQQLLRAQSPPTKLRTVITSVVSNGAKKDNKPPSPVEAKVLPSLFSNLSASALASLQSSLQLGEASAASPTLSSPPLSPILGYPKPEPVVKQEVLQPALSGDPAKPFRCTLCGKHLASKNVFQLHLRSHSGEKPFACGLCGHHFSQKTSLTRHMRSHTGERPFPCDVCGKRFADKERIKIHMRTHTGEKPFACEVCGKRFSQKSTVKRHMSVHTGEKPFKCEACGKGFANRGNLNAHSKTHAST